MRRSIVMKEDFQYELASYLSYVSGGCNTSDRSRMLSIIKKAISTELTELQRLCIEEHYLKGRKMKDIAASLSVNPSTVTRHIRRAKDKLRHIASYY